jgi:hypothetical protein
MVSYDDSTNLADFEYQDVFDVVIKLEKSFGLKFEKEAFSNVETFGDLCDVFENYLNYPHVDDCTKQQAFYQVRKAISATQKISEDQIKLESTLSYLFPRNNRRKKAKEFKNYLGIDIKILTYPGWLASVFVIGFLLSLVAFFFDWKIALTGILFFISASKIANYLGKDLNLLTVRALTEKLSTEYYIDIRRTSGTINRKEISQIIIDMFSTDLGIEKTNLTRETKFSWSK